MKAVLPSAKVLAGLGAILVLYVLAIVWLRPAANFGSIQDDAIYFASAKAIAAGQGYVLPSFPGGLPRLKYPELYPWVLSWIWRADARFPGNVIPAIALTVVFGCWFLVASYLVARQSLGLEAGWALAVTAACAFNFFSLVMSGSVLSDLPFAALALTALLAAEGALGSAPVRGRGGRPDEDHRGKPGALTGAGAGWGWTAVAVVLAGTSVGFRSVGAAVVAGMVLIALLRRAYGRAIVFCVVGGALALPWVLPEMLRAMASHSQLAAALPQGWTETLSSYVSYIDQWRLFAPTWLVRIDVVGKNLLNAFEDPGIFLLLPLANRNGLISVLAGSAVALAAWAGTLLAGRRTGPPRRASEAGPPRYENGSGWKPIHGAFLFYLAMVLPFPFQPHRYLVPFLPLFMGGLMVTAREAARWSARTIRPGFPVAARAQAAGLGAALLAVGALAAINLGYAAPRQLAGLMRSQRSLLTQEAESYRWIREHTPPGARFIAYDDVLLYLYTGRQAIRPICCSSAASYANDISYAQRNADHLADVARHVAANYWLFTTADFGTELNPDQRILQDRERQMLGSLPLVFSSEDGRVRIYDLARFQAVSPQRR